MDEKTKELHLKAGLACGVEKVCVNQKINKPKVDYGSFETAFKNAEKLSVKFGREMEPYPCPFCNGWHIGRKMSVEELEELAASIAQLD